MKYECRRLISHFIQLILHCTQTGFLRWLITNLFYVTFFMTWKLPRYDAKDWRKHIIHTSRLLMKPGTSRVYFLYAHVSPTHPHTHTQAGTCKTLTSRVIGARCVGVRARVCVSMGVWFLISEQTQMGRRNRHGLSHWSSRSRAFLFLRFTR